MGRTETFRLDPASLPRQPAASGKPRIWADPRCLPRVQWMPPQPGQQALTVRFQAAGRVSGGLGPWSRGEGTRWQCSAPSLGTAWDTTSSHLLSKRLYCVIFHSGVNFQSENDLRKAD